MASLAVALPGCGGPSTGRTDVILITIDTLRADHLGCTGHPGIRTPVIDSLAAAGALFENTVCQVPLTLPSHGSILTGLYPNHHGVRVNEDYFAPDGPATLAEVLKGSGYATGAFVGGFPLESGFGLDRGFDVYDDEFTSDAERTLPGDHRARAERTAGEVVDAATAWLRATGADPLFLWVHVYDPHDPYEPPDGYAEGYAGEVEYVDEQIGRLLGSVRARSRSRLVIVVADHGEGLMEHDEPTHGLFIYDTTIRVPLVLAGAGVDAGQRISTQVQTVDVFPTVLEMVGVGAPGGLDGRSVAAAVKGGGSVPPRPAYIESLYAAGLGWAPLHGLRTEGWKYIEAPTPELYDLASDPRETDNVIGAEAERARSLSADLVELAGAEAGPAPRVDEEKLERLRSLGYVGAAGSPADAAGADPKDRVHIANAVARAEGLAVARDTEGAIELYEHTFPEDDRNPFIANRLGNLHKRSGNHTSAITWYRRALSLRDSPETHYQLADAFYRAGERDSAVTHYRRTLEGQPRRVAAHVNLGVCLLELGRREEARDALRKAVSLEPDHGIAVSTLGVTEMLLGDPDRAYKLLRRGQSLQRDAFTFHYELGVLHLRAGDVGAAVSELLQVTGDKEPHALLNLAAAEARRGRTADGVAYLRRAVEMGGEPLRERARRDRRLAPLRNAPGGRELLGDS